MDSASLPRPSRSDPVLPWVEGLLPPSLLRRPPEAPRVAAPPRERVLVVPPEVPLPVLEVPLEAVPPLAATLFLVAVLAEARPRLEVLLEAEEPPLRVAEEPPRLAAPPLLAVERPPAALREADEPLLAEDLEAPLEEEPPLEALLEEPPLEALLEPPPLEAAPPLAATAFLVDLLAEANPRLAEPPLEAVLRPPAELLEVEEPLLEAEDLEALLEPLRLAEPPLEALLEEPPLEALLEPPPLEAAPPLAATAFLVDLLAEANPRLDELLEAEDPPREEDDPLRLAEDFDAPPLEALLEPPRLAEPPLLATLFLVALLADARLLEEEPLEALPLLAVLRPPEELFEALLDAPLREALPLEAEDPLLEEEDPLLEEEPPRLEDELLVAAFLEADLDEELPPALLLPAFLAAAFLVDVAIFNGFCVRVNKICVLKLQSCK